VEIHGILHCQSNLPCTQPVEPSAVMRDSPNTSQSQSDAGFFARLEGLILVSLLLLLALLKVLYAFVLRIDSDETQHLHVVWGWANGFLPYRDLFDNHSPLFQILYAPIFGALGERPDIIVPMRLAVIPVNFLCLWLVYKCGAMLFSRRVGIWAAIAAGAFPVFFIKSSEFRTDDLWAALWLLSIWVLLRRPFKRSNVFLSGLALGASFATSMKTILLAIALALSLTVLLIGKALRREKVNWRSLPVAALSGFLGVAAVPVLVVAFFGLNGALPSLYYCTIQHNVLPGLFRWSRVWTQSRWFLPLGALISILGYLNWRNLPVMFRRDRTAVIALTLLAYFLLLGGFWPIVQTQDFLPVIPLIILLLVAAGTIAPLSRYQMITFPLLVGAEIVVLLSTDPPRSNAMADKLSMISNVLTLTTKEDFVMDAKGETVFRRRPFYYVLEGMTLRRIAFGRIKDDIPECLIATRTPVATLLRMPPRATDFIEHNYVQVAFRTCVLGKILATQDENFPKTYEFDVAVPERYVLLPKRGPLVATLDGSPFGAARFLQTGHHRVQVFANTGRLALIWARAAEKHFSPFGPIVKDEFGPAD